MTVMAWLTSFLVKYTIYDATSLKSYHPEIGLIAEDDFSMKVMVSYQLHEIPFQQVFGNVYGCP